jgi:hypothetical protein
MPTKLADGKWIIPWMELMKLAAPDGIKDQRINLSNLRVYSCLAYTGILGSKRSQSDKMAPRAEIGWLVGYVSKNLYRIWFPHKGGQHGRIDVVKMLFLMRHDDIAQLRGCMKKKLLVR